MHLLPRYASITPTFVLIADDDFIGMAANRLD